jgi:hypothetical protein
MTLSVMFSHVVDQTVIHFIWPTAITASATHYFGH